VTTEAAAGSRDHVARAARALGPESHWASYFGRNSKSFRFASWLFPRTERRVIAGVYAFCRFTDDLVDESDADVETARGRVEAWRELSRAAYDGESTGIPLLDIVMPRMSRGGAPFDYVDDLLHGVSMDLDPVSFDTLDDLYVYTYRVAGVVGGWITEQFGLHEPDLLDRAYSLGHAMQLTNILRDVGEDWRRERLYLPRRMLDACGVSVDAVGRVAADGTPVPTAYADLMESLMLVADHHYERAFEALPSLPGWYGRPVAVAARIYQGIHDSIREHDYDNGQHRAFTSFGQKLRLGASGLRELSRAKRRADHEVRADA